MDNKDIFGKLDVTQRLYPKKVDEVVGDMKVPLDVNAVDFVFAILQILKPVNYL